MNNHRKEILIVANINNLKISTVILNFIQLKGLKRE